MLRVRVHSQEERALLKFGKHFGALKFVGLCGGDEQLANLLLRAAQQTFR